MIEVELEIAGKPPGEIPFEGSKKVQLCSIPRMREYIVIGSNYYEVDKVFYWEGDRPPKIIIRYSGYL